MFFIFLFLLFSSLKAQYYNQQQQQYPSNNYNPWSPYSQNYPTWNQGIQQNRVSVRGNLLSDDPTVLPYGSQIRLSLTDVSLQDVASRPLNSITLYGSYRFPIAFDVPYSLAQVQSNMNNIRQYTIQARIEKDGQLLYINDQYTPVQLLPAPINPVNVYMKKVGVWTGPGTGGIYSTRPPITNNMFACQQMPDVGPCRANIQQFYFNPQFRSCQIFIWGGCDGNLNRFSSQEECERTCSFYRRRVSRNNSKQRWF